MRRLPPPRDIKHRIHRKVAQRLPEKKSPDLSTGQGLGRCRFPLFPLGGSVSAVSSLQLRPVFSAVSSRVPPSNTMSCFVSFGNKSQGSFKNSFQTRGFEFSHLSQRARRTAFRGSISTKTPALKLKCLFACEPPATIVSELTRVVCAPFAKPQVATLRHS